MGRENKGKSKYLPCALNEPKDTQIEFYDDSLIIVVYIEKKSCRTNVGTFFEILTYFFKNKIWSFFLTGREGS